MHSALAASFAAAGGGGGSHLAQGWSKFWASLSGSFSSLVVLLTVIGALMVVGGILGYLYQKRKGQAQTGPLVFTILLGLILAGPQLILPGLLKLIDMAGGMLSNFFNGL